MHLVLAATPAAPAEGDGQGQGQGAVLELLLVAWAFGWPRTFRRAVFRGLLAIIAQTATEAARYLAAQPELEASEGARQCPATLLQKPSKCLLAHISLGHAELCGQPGGMHRGREALRHLHRFWPRAPQLHQATPRNSTQGLQQQAFHRREALI
eukprot:CAMPEP_0179076390 /NCGR_PEP_ID=MMETSP0796-20121207/34077_1 /TAXON_ID=73915 /ORGANISM="Pyrodinium bahamense, Strain pbaha01" /LENGTH=153 /DNA_ID=CAMNT_0020773643 /DNA_START=212 /DNA_END=670 /DNA_ORIENTATION=-